MDLSRPRFSNNTKSSQHEWDMFKLDILRIADAKVRDAFLSIYHALGDAEEAEKRVKSAMATQRFELDFIKAKNEDKRREDTPENG